MAKTFKLTIARVGEQLFNGDALSVSLPGEAGVFTVMASHEPFVSSLKAGTAIVKDAAGKTQSFPVSAGGVAEISRGQATVLV